MPEVVVLVVGVMAFITINIGVGMILWKMILWNLIRGKRK